MIGKLSAALFLLVSLLVAITSASKSQPKCSTGLTFKGQEFLAHESNCAKFYECSNGIPYPYDCQAGLHFDLNKKVCALPIIAGCASAVEGSDVDPAAAFVDLPDNLLDPLEHAVRKEDFEGSGYLKWPVSKVNEPVDEDEDESSGGFELTTTTPPTGEKTCPAVDTATSIYYPHESDCGLFYQCSNGEAVLQTCPAGLHFNPIKHVCDWPADAGCATSSQEVTEPEGSGSEGDGEAGVDASEGSGDDSAEATTQTPDVDSCPAVDPVGTSVYLPHETNCAKFYQCSNGARILMNCPRGLYFNPIINVCDYPPSAECAAAMAKEAI